MEGSMPQFHKARSCRNPDGTGEHRCTREQWLLLDLLQPRDLEEFIWSLG
jgi:hypothetical protein